MTSVIRFQKDQAWKAPPSKPGQHGSHSSIAPTRALEIFMKFVAIAALVLAVAVFASGVSQGVKAADKVTSHLMTLDQRIEAASK